MASENGAYTRARLAFGKAGKDTAVRARPRVCGTELGHGETCPATGIYVETYRGVSYHFKGKCEAGHLTERYGYAEAPVVDA